MFKVLISIFLLFTSLIAKENVMSIYDITVKDIKGNDVSLEKYKGKVLLIVNVASKCGFTGQYEDLENLYAKHKDKDFMILGFPSNQFANQEPGSNKEIAEFCRLTYGVEFDMFSKIDVNGENESPLYTYLKEKQPGILGTKDIKWNFTKFLIDKEGNIVDRFGSSTNPKSIEDDILKLL